MEHILITYWLAELFLGNLKRGVEWLAAVVVPWIVAAKAAARTKMVEFTREVTEMLVVEDTWVEDTMLATKQVRPGPQMTTDLERLR